MVGVYGIGGHIFFDAIFLAIGFELPIGHIGLLMAITPIIGGLVSPFAGNLADRLGNRLVMGLGLILMTVGCISISTFDADLTDYDYILRVIPLGLGWGIFQSPNNSAILGAVSPERLGIASGLLSLTRTLGQTTGLPLMAAIFTTTTLAGTTAKDVSSASPGAIVGGFQSTFQLAALCLFIATGLTFMLDRMEKSKR